MAINSAKVNIACYTDSRTLKGPYKLSYEYSVLRISQIVHFNEVDFKIDVHLDMKTACCPNMGVCIK